MANHNLHLIKSRRSYNITEMALLLGVDRKTCQRWIKTEGLKVIEKGVVPLLIMGMDLHNFLKTKREKRRFILKKDEFFCMKCHKPVKAKAENEKTIKTGKKIGKSNSDQYKKTGICEVCDTQVNKFLEVYQQD